MIKLLIIALVLRASGTSGRLDNGHPLLCTTGWILCTMSSWIAIGAMGAWFPLWPALLLGLFGSLADLRIRRKELWIIADIVVVTLSGLLSIPPLEFGLLAGTAVAVTALGFAMDWFLGRFSKPIRIVVFMLPLVACIAVSITKPSGVAYGFRLLRGMLLHNSLLHIGLTPVHAADRVMLDTKAIAWLECPSGEGPFPGALFFHGAHRDASKQPAAIIARRALLDAGYVVLSVDHPGYGESPTPPPDACVDAWNPLPTVLSALDVLRSRSDVKGVFVLGHSMGCTDAMRLLCVVPKLRGAVLFGASLGGENPYLDEQRNEYWYRRFHTDRRMRCRLSRERVLEIRKRFYDDAPFLQALRRDHVPILFVRFELEHRDIVSWRDAYYDAIPGRKAIWDFGNSTHYFSSYGCAGFIVGDTRITRSLASRLRLLASKPHNGLMRERNKRYSRTSY